MGVNLSIPNNGGGFLGSCANLGNYFDTLSRVRQRIRPALTARTRSRPGLIRHLPLVGAKQHRGLEQLLFRCSFTQGPNPLTASNAAGYGLPSYLLGNGSGSINSDGPGENLQTVYWGLYFQDDWKITSKLTLNLGIRYDNPRPWTERFNRITSWCGSCPVTIAGMQLQGGLAFPGSERPFAELLRSG